MKTYFLHYLNVKHINGKAIFTNIVKAVMLFVALCQTVPSTAFEVKAKYITTADGLSDNTIRYVFQDSKGFIWMATLNGLNRYDGRNVRTFVPSNDGRLSLADRRVNHIKEDKNGFLWMATSPNYISCYDLKRDKFVDFTGCGGYMRNYEGFTFTKSGTWLWGDDGCLRVTYSNGRFTSERFSRDNKKLRGNKVQRVVECGKNAWILTTRGLYLWSNGKVRTVSRNMNAAWAVVSGGKSFFAEFDGSVWVYKNGLRKIGTIPDVNGSSDIPGYMQIGNKWYLCASSGVYEVDVKRETLTKTTGSIDMKRAKTFTDNCGDHWMHNGTGLLRRVDGRTGQTHDFRLMTDATLRLIDQERYHVVHARDGIIWIGTYGNGLFAYDTRNGSLTQYKAGRLHPALVQSDYIMYLSEDRSGNIWAGAWQAGVSMITVADNGEYEPALQGAGAHTLGTVRMLCVEPQRVWIGNTSGALFSTDAAMKALKREPNDDGNIYAIARDSKGTLWKGSRTHGLFIGGKRYVHNDKDAASLSHNSIFTILKDRRGRMWVGTFGGGLDLAVPDGKGGYRFRHFLGDSYGHKRIRCMTLDAQGWIWAGTSDGLVVFNPDKLAADPKAWHSYNRNNHKLYSNEIRSIFCDRHGRVWIAETGSGFALCRPGKDYSQLQFEHYGVSNGLVNSMVQGFAEDRQGYLWVSTEYGLSCFNIKNKVFRNFFFAPTMAGNTYSENCAATLADGRLAFGTSTGMAVVDPAKIHGKSTENTVTFTNLVVNGMSMTADDPDYPLEEALPYAKVMKLKYDQNSFVVSFSALDFSAEAQTLYSYRLENYDKDWSSPSALDFAAYKNLSPGTYYLHVRATDADGTWSKKESVLKIVITPPLWASPVAYLIYALLLSVAAWLSLRTFRKMNALRTQVKIEEQLADYKLVFFTNISHEFRTPLTLIQAAMERLRKAENNAKDRATAVRMMSKSVDRMLRLINELLEFRKAEKGKLTLQLEQTDIVALLKSFSEPFVETAANKKMTYKFEPEEPSCTIPVDRGKLDKVVYNLLSNAFKYTPTGGTVVMTACVDNAGARFLIKVRDTGVGIPKAQREKMFTRFDSGNVSRNSIGIGLHLVYELVKAHKGTISYDENPGGGSVFTVSLPLDGSAYQSSDYLDKDSVLLEEEQKEDRRQTELTAEKAEIQAVDRSSTGDDTPVITKPMNDRVILVIEDDDDVRALLVSELSVYATVVARPDGTSGYDYARNNDVDLILCDVMMPGMDGFEVTRRLKDNFDTSHIPIILLTALSAEESRLKGAQCGADSYITKPFSTRLLLTCVFKLIEQREKLKEKFSNDITAVRPLISTTDKDKDFVDQLTEVVTSNLSNPDFTIEDFASAMSIGRTILYRKVKGVTGYAPKEYLRIMRMKKAAELLLSPDVNVSEVAYAVGLGDPFYFSKCFKQQFGVSPSTYKKNGGITGEAPQAAE